MKITICAKSVSDIIHQFHKRCQSSIVLLFIKSLFVFLLFSYRNKHYTVEAKKGSTPLDWLKIAVTVYNPESEHSELPMKQK